MFPVNKHAVFLDILASLPSELLPPLLGNFASLGFMQFLKSFNSPELNDSVKVSLSYVTN